mmetsp:Transcript_77438/g.201583  ORF Transcript_77438/g.201583 Transcript_77438/m.201583 type:complete len:310 (+) Transcript_77438:583-1512(+)
MRSEAPCGPEHRPRSRILAQSAWCSMLCPTNRPSSPRATQSMAPAASARGVAKRWTNDKASCLRGPMSMAPPTEVSRSNLLISISEATGSARQRWAEPSSFKTPSQMVANILGISERQGPKIGNCLPPGVREDSVFRQLSSSCSGSSFEGGVDAVLRPPQRSKVPSGADTGQRQRFKSCESRTPLPSKHKATKGLVTAASPISWIIQPFCLDVPRTPTRTAAATPPSSQRLKTPAICSSASGIGSRSSWNEPTMRVVPRAFTTASIVACPTVHSTSSISTPSRMPNLSNSKYSASEAANEPPWRTDLTV